MAMNRKEIFDRMYERSKRRYWLEGVKAYLESTLQLIDEEHEELKGSYEDEADLLWILSNRSQRMSIEKTLEYINSALNPDDKPF